LQRKPFFTFHSPEKNGFPHGETHQNAHVLLEGDRAALSGVYHRLLKPKLMLTMKVDAFSATVPESATMLLPGSGLIGVAGFRRKWRKE
jgi:hypothetical protein